MAVTSQIKVSLGTVEVTDTERRAVAWYIDGAALDSGQLAERDTMRVFLLGEGKNSLNGLVDAFLDAGGQTASMQEHAAIIQENALDRIQRPGQHEGRQ